MATSALDFSTWTTYSLELQARALKYDRAARLVVKEGWFWNTLAWALYIFSFGEFTREQFLEGFATSIGPVVGLPRKWNKDQVAALLPHEVGGHVAQCRRFGLWVSPWVGLPFYTLAYLLLPLPAFGAWIRYRLELAADVVAWREGLRERTLSPIDVRDRALRFADTVASAAYLWSVPRPWARWGFERKARKVVAEVASGVA